MCIGKEGDLTGVPPGECAVRMARAGADVGQSSFLASDPQDSYVYIFNIITKLAILIYWLIKLANSKVR